MAEPLSFISEAVWREQFDAACAAVCLPQVSPGLVAVQAALCLSAFVVGALMPSAGGLSPALHRMAAVDSAHWGHRRPRQSSAATSAARQPGKQTDGQVNAYCRA